VFVLPYVNQKWEIRFNGGKREAIFILKNENKTYAEIAKLLKIARISVYYILKNFGNTSFSSHKNQSGRRRKTTKNDEDRIVIIIKLNRHLTDVRHHFGDEPNLPMYASCIYGKKSSLFSRIANKKPSLSIQNKHKRLQ
jgi:hypothetical protein